MRYIKFPQVAHLSRARVARERRFVCSIPAAVATFRASPGIKTLDENACRLISCRNESGILRSCSAVGSLGFRTNKPSSALARKLLAKGKWRIREHVKTLTTGRKKIKIK